MIQQNPKRWIALLLTLMLLVGIAPRSYATEETMPETIPVTLPEVTEETTPETIPEPTTDAMRLEIAPYGGAASLGQIKNNIEVLTKEFDRLLEQNTMASESERRFAEIARQLTKLRKQQEAVSSNLRNNAAERARTNAIEKTLDQAEHHITQWSEEIIRQIVHTVRVISADHIKVILYDGTEIDQEVHM